MKRIALLTVLLMTLCLSSQAQSKWDGFFKPVDQELLVRQRELGQPSSAWIFRPVVEISALQLTWDKDLKTFNSTSLTSGGMGIGYQHYIEVNGVPYNNYGFNALLLFGMSTDVEEASIALAATVSALRFINLGVGYDFGGAQLFFLTGIAYNF
jgi:hypothetical protein